MTDRLNLPLSEQYHRAAMDFVDADAAATILEETKSAVLAEMVGALIKDDPKMSVAKAEILVKGSPEWSDWISKMVRARKLANRLRVERDVVKMRFQEWISADANHRAGARM